MAASEESLKKALRLEQLKYYSEHLVVPILNVATEGYEHAKKESIKDPNGVHGIRYADGVIQVENTEYIEVTPQAGDNPKALGWYELTIGGSYILTEDETVLPGKVYYRANSSWDEAEPGGTPESLAIPTVNGSSSFTYDGTAKTLSFLGVDTSKMTVTGTEGTVAGTYTATITLKSTKRYVWADSTTEPKTYTWTIGKAAGSATLSQNAVTLSADHLSDSVNVSNATGAVTVGCSDTSVVTATYSNGVISLVTPEEKTGTATVTVYVAATENYEAASFPITVTALFSSIWGAEWDGTSTTAWSRTDAAEGFVNPVPAVANGNGSSPFDNCMPWSGMRRVTDATGGVLVEIPKYWFKWTRSGSKMKLQISDGPQDGFFVSPAHADRGDGKGERDVVYVGAYHCDGNYKSTAGVKPAANKTRATFRTGIKGLGAGFYQYDYAMYWTIMMLYLVEYADWNSQKTIGYGCGNNSGTENNGLCDAMTYHTGTNAASRTNYGHVRYRWIEGLWDNVQDWCDGIYFGGANVYGIKNPESFSDNSGGTLISTRPTSSNYISAWSNPTANGFEYALYPTAVSGSESTYVCDYCNYNLSGVVLRVGGHYSRSQDYGAFGLYAYDAASGAYASIGSRLQKLP